MYYYFILLFISFLYGEDLLTHEHSSHSLWWSNDQFGTIRDHHLPELDDGYPLVSLPSTASNCPEFALGTFSGHGIYASLFVSEATTVAHVYMGELFFSSPVTKQTGTYIALLNSISIFIP